MSETKVQGLNLDLGLTFLCDHADCGAVADETFHLFSGDVQFCRAHLKFHVDEIQRQIEASPLPYMTANEIAVWAAQ